MKEKLIPPDLKQCQAEKPNGNSFMTLGGVPGLERCRSEPTLIAHESKRADGKKSGSMSLCLECSVVCKKQIPGITFTAIRKQK